MKAVTRVFLTALVLAGALLSQRSVDLASISGNVLGPKGKPVRKATVMLTPLDRAPNAGPAERPYGALSDAAGHYSFDGVKPGRYSIRVEHSGYLPGSFRPEKSGMPLTLRAGERKDGVNIEMVQESSISGTVLDDDGDPVAGARVTAFRRTYAADGQVRYMQSGVTATDDSGSYKTGSLIPGKYLIRAVPRQVEPVRLAGAPPGKPDEALVSTLYPGTTDLNTAEVILVSGGEQLLHRNISLRRSALFHVRGQILLPPVASPPQAHVQPVFVALNPAENGMGEVTGSALAPDGSFDIRGVSPGSYALAVRRNSDRTGPLAIQHVDVGAADVNGVIPVPVARADLKGTVDPGKLPAQQRQVSLSPFDSAGISGPVMPVPVSADGSFTIPQIPLAQYRVAVTPLPPAAYVRSLRMGDEERMGIGIDLRQGIAAPLRITLGDDATQLKGTVKNNSGDGVSACTVTLIPVATVSTHLYRTVTCGRDGHFEIRNVPPGRYRIDAWSNLQAGDQFDPDFIKAHANDGQAVSVSPGVPQELSLLVK